MIKIIMCTYNGERYLGQQIQSILANTRTDWQLVISDDGSVDATYEIIEAYRKQYPNKISARKHEASNGAARHFLEMIRTIKGEMQKDDLIMLCDQDDVWNQDKIERTDHVMQRLVAGNGNKTPLLVCSDVCITDSDLHVMEPSFAKANHYNIKNIGFAQLMMENKVQGCTIMINKALADMIERIPGHMTMHDCWLGLVAAAFGKLEYINKPTMKYRQHAENVMGNINFWTDMRNKMHNLEKQREIVMSTTVQIAEFIEIYGDRLSEEHRKEATAFALLPQQNFLRRRYTIIKYRMWKSGILRNIGLMILI